MLQTIKKKKSSALLFDLDGTLVNSIKDIAYCVNNALDKLKRPLRTETEVQSFIGNGTDKMILRSLGKKYEKEFQICLKYFENCYKKNYLLHTKPYEGIIQLISYFSNRFYLGVITNKNYYFADLILEGLELKSHFTRIVGGDTLPEKKPDPSAILRFAEDFKIHINNIIMIGDHYTDIQTGINAGCKTIFCKYGIGETRGLIPDEYVNSANEIKFAVERINSSFSNTQ